MKTKSITLLILMLAFLSIFSVNIHFINNIDQKLDRYNFFKAQVSGNEVEEKDYSSCNQSADSLSTVVSGELTWAMFATNIAIVILQPLNF